MGTEQSPTNDYLANWVCYHWTWLTYCNSTACPLPVWLVVRRGRCPRPESLIQVLAAIIPMYQHTVDSCGPSAQSHPGITNQTCGLTMPQDSRVQMEYRMTSDYLQQSFYFKYCSTHRFWQRVEPWETIFLVTVLPPRRSLLTSLLEDKPSPGLAPMRQKVM